MNYCGILNITQTQEFFNLFNELEVGRMTNVHAVCIENGRRKEVHLNPIDAGKELLIASFADGELFRAGWTEVFHEVHFDYHALRARIISGF